MDLTPIGPLQSSALQLGAMYFGTRTGEATSRSLLDAYLAGGGNFIDTSNNYAFWPDNGKAGASEEVLGRWLKDRGRRDDVMIATKVGALPNRPGGGFGDMQGLGRATIIEAIDQSLKRLGTDYVDLYYAHIDDRTTPLEETLSGLDAVVRAGKVRAIGCSNIMSYRIEAARRISRASGYPEYVCVQQRHSFLKVHAHADHEIARVMGRRGGHGIGEGTTPEILDYAAENPGFRIVAYSPVLKGAYADRSRLEDNYKSAENDARLAVLDAVAAETGASAGQIVLKWLIETGVIPLMAVSSLGQLEENLAAARLELSDDQMARLNAAA